MFICYIVVGLLYTIESVLFIGAIRDGLVARQVRPAGDADALVEAGPGAGALLRAGAVLGGVGQILLQRDAVVAHERVGQLAGGALAAAVAAAVLRVRRALHQGLGRDPDVGGRALALELRLQGLRRGDGPAAAAVALVADLRGGHLGPGGEGRRGVHLHGQGRAGGAGLRVEEGDALAAARALARGLVALVQDLVDNYDEIKYRYN